MCLSDSFLYVNVTFQRSEVQLTPSHLKIPKLQPEKPDIETASVSESSDDEYEDNVTLAQYLKSVIVMPKALRILCLTNLFCWMGYLSFCLYFTDFVAEAVFHGDPSVSLKSFKSFYNIVLTPSFHSLLPKTTTSTKKAFVLVAGAWPCRPWRQQSTQK